MRNSYRIPLLTTAAMTPSERRLGRFLRAPEGHGGDNTYTKEQVDAAIASAVEKAVEGLKAKNEELIGDNKKLKADLRKTQDVDPAEVERLHNELDEIRGKLTTAEKAAREATKARETIEASLKGEQGFTHKLLVENSLREQLAANGVTHAVHQKAAMALLSPQMRIEVEGDNRVAKAGDKALADFVKEWAGSDEGKHFVAAPGNSGGGAQGGSSQASSKTISRAAFSGMDPTAQMAFVKDGGTVQDAAA